jgi:hypothetical protein
LTLLFGAALSQSGATADFLMASTWNTLDDDSEGIRQVSRTTNLWVDAVHGDDKNDGLARASAVRTIQRAADLAGPGTTVHLLPGAYRETVQPAKSGTVSEPILYVAENGPGTVALRGSESSTSLRWRRLSTNTIGLPPDTEPTNVYYTDLSGWGLGGAPRFVVQIDGNGEVVRRLPLAREPDWQVVSDWKHHEFWWAADGGWAVAPCNPATDPDHKCDSATWSKTQLIDRTNDAEPAGIESGNLTTLGNLTGATLVILDTHQGHWVYRRTVVGHSVSDGRVTVDEPCEYGSSTAGLGWGAKYYAENLPSLLDNPGEWWYDTASRRLYLWPPGGSDPSTMSIEISRRDSGFVLDDRSYTTLDGLTIEFLNGHAISQDNGKNHKSYNNTVRNVILRYANYGLWLHQAVRADVPSSNVTDGFVLENSEIAYMDNRAIRMGYAWDDGSDPDSFTRSGVRNTRIRSNELHHLGFRTDSDLGYGIEFINTDRLRFENNHVHHTAHHGVLFRKSVIQSSKEYDFRPDEIKTGEILIQNNLFERACQLTTECAAVKIWGRAPDNHVYRDVLIVGNVFRDTFGWTYVSEKREFWTGGSSSIVRGLGGFALDVDMASGVHIYRNIVYNNAYYGFRFAGAWRDGDIVVYNNVIANSLFGISLGGSRYDTHSSVNTQVVNNIVVNSEGFGIRQSISDDFDTDMTIDYNLYYQNGWRSRADGGLYDPGNMVIYRKVGNNSYYQTLSEIRANTPWESHGVEGNPRFWAYDPSDHDLFDGSWPNFRLTPSSTRAINRGDGLPNSLTRLLKIFGVSDARWGAAYDIGRYEWFDENSIKHIFIPLVSRDADH